MPEDSICTPGQVATGRVDTAFDEYAQLREIVVGKERDGLQDLNLRFDEFERDLMDRVGGRIVEAFEARTKENAEADEELGLVLRGPVEHAIRSSITNDRAELSKTLFPIMGPATRDYVTSLFRGMVEDFNEVIQNTTSINRLGWRVGAKLSGKPYSEYILLKTLNYRVEEIFLMQPNSGMLLQHIAVEDVDGERDADLVSGMFSAIRSFVQDSFSSNPGELTETESIEGESELGGFTFGSRQVIIEAGPSAIIAASVEGTPPPDFRNQLQGILEELQADHADQLDNFSGDPEEMEFTREALQPAMIENASKESEGGGLWRVWLILGLLVAGLATWGVLSWKKEKRLREFIATVEAQPGIEAVRVEDGDDKKRITGMRDPLAADLQQLAADSGYEPDEFDFQFVPYHSVGTSFDQQRRSETAAREVNLRKTLEAEMTGRSRSVAIAQIKSQFGAANGLEIVQDDAGGLRVSGTVSEPAYSTILKGILPYRGIFSDINTTDLKDSTPAEIERLTSEISKAKIMFISGTTSLADGAFDEILKVVEAVNTLGKKAKSTGREPRLELRARPLTGTNDTYLQEAASIRLTKFRDLLVENGVPVNYISDLAIDDEHSYAASSSSVYLIPIVIQTTPETP